MFKKLGKIITILNVTGFVLVMLVGGTSIYFAKQILDNGYKIEHIGLEINEVDNFRTDALRLIHHVHTFFITKNPVYSAQAYETVASIRKQVHDYEVHKHDNHRVKSQMETRLFGIISRNVEGMVLVSNLIEEFSMAGILDRDKLKQLERFIYEIEDTAIMINKMHLNQIAEWEKDSMATMWKILILYVIFVVGGGVAVLIGHRLLTRKVAKPIMEVATATLEFAEGRYSKRVHTDSKTEIGKLYEAFNEMADKLQERDELLRTFNEKLENKVRERTIELETAHEKLRRTEKIAAVGQIAAGVTHEVRHPLNSLALSAHELSKEISGKLGDDSPAYKSSRLFNFEINRINNILEEFINFAKFPEPRFFDNDINKVIGEVVDMFGSLKEKGVNIELLLDERIPSFKFDARQVKEIFINLLENACKATENGGRVEIKTAISNHNVMIKVRDTGRGISDNVMEKIFSPFFSTDDAGLGLGLPIVQKIVESHGGKINCSSKVGQGTEFEITLPTEAAVGVLL